MTNKTNKTNKAINSAIEQALEKALESKVEQVEQEQVDFSEQDVNETIYKASIFACYYLLRKGKRSLYDNQDIGNLLLNAIDMSKVDNSEFTKLLMHIYQSFVDMSDKGIITIRQSALDMVRQYAKDSGKSIIKSAWILYQEKRITYTDYKQIMESED